MYWSTSHISTLCLIALFSLVANFALSSDLGDNHIINYIYTTESEDLYCIHHKIDLVTIEHNLGDVSSYYITIG